MGWLRWLFLESFAALAIALFFVNFTLLVHWRRSGKSRPLLIGLVLGVMLLAIQSMVVTRHELAGGILTAVELEMPAARVDALAAALSAAFECDGMDDEEFIAFAERGLKRVDVNLIRRMSLSIASSTETSFVARVVYLSDVRVAEVFDRLIKTVWEVTFVQEGGQWRIERIQVIRVGEVEVSDIRELRP
ncbi:MAG: hypothetical protein IID33_14160 [Planctomycetes bacterium]|nr:hypothetical protein [Planctomycetota bacterium]